RFPSPTLFRSLPLGLPGLHGAGARRTRLDRPRLRRGRCHDQRDLHCDVRAVVLGSLSPTIDGAGRSTVTIATTKRTATPSRCRRIGTSVPVCCGSIRTHEQTTSATI